MPRAKHVVLNDNITADLFGASQPYFDNRIKGKQLEVIQEDWYHFIVRDDDMQVFYVPRDSATIVIPKEVSHA
jgi:hypothetical protein